MKIAIKREQRQSVLGYAEREQFRAKLKTKKLLFVAAALTVLTACSSDDSSIENNEGRVPVKLAYTTIDAVETRAAQNLNQGNFASGENVTVRVSNTGVGEWTDYTFTTGDAGAMSPTSTVPYYPAGTQNIDIVAYYPATAGTSFTVATDQTSDANYKASDLMFASVTNQPKTTDAVNLNFAHKMAKLAVNITAGQGVSSITSVSLLNVKPTVSFNQATGAVGAASGDATSIAISNEGAAIIPAQTINGGLLSIVTPQGTATYSVSNKAFEAGKLYTMNISVNLSAVNTTTNITNWISEGTLNITPSDLTVSVSGTYTYTGSAIVPPDNNIIVRSTKGNTRISNSQYNVYVENNINAGEASLVVYGKGTSFIGEFAYCTFTIGKATGSISYATTSVDKTITSANFTNPLTNTGDGTVTYSSSNTDVATVDPSTGEVTIAGMGTATITATPADGPNYTYASTASYTLNVNDLSTLAQLKDYVNAGHDGSAYVGYEVNSAGDIAASNVSGTLIGYISYVSSSNVDTDVSGSRILVIASADAGSNLQWGSWGTNRGLTTDGMFGYTNTNTLQALGQSAHPAAYAAWNYNVAIPSGGATPAHWFLPTKAQYEAIKNAFGGYSTFQSKAHLATSRDYKYWTSTESSGYNNTYQQAYAMWADDGVCDSRDRQQQNLVRACFAY